MFNDPSKFSHIDKKSIDSNQQKIQYIIPIVCTSIIQNLSERDMSAPTTNYKISFRSDNAHTHTILNWSVTISICIRCTCTGMRHVGCEFEFLLKFSIKRIPDRDQWSRVKVGHKWDDSDLHGPLRTFGSFFYHG